MKKFDFWFDVLCDEDTPSGEIDNNKVDFYMWGSKFKKNENPTNKRKKFWKK